MDIIFELVYIFNNVCKIKICNSFDEKIKYKIHYNRTLFKRKKNFLISPNNVHTATILLEMDELPPSFFEGCVNLISFSLLKLKKKINCSHMFENCINLRNFNIPNDILESDGIANCMFKNCQSINEINLENLSLKNMENMNEMFYNCSNLSKISFSMNPANKIISCDSMFSFTKIPKVDLDMLRENNNEIDMSNMFAFCFNLKKVDLSFIQNNKNKLANICYCADTFLKVSRKNYLQAKRNHENNMIIEI